MVVLLIPAFHLWILPWEKPSLDVFSSPRTGSLGVLVVVDVALGVVGGRDSGSFLSQSIACCLLVIASDCYLLFVVSCLWDE